MCIHSVLIQVVFLQCSNSYRVPVSLKQHIFTFPPSKLMHPEHLRFQMAPSGILGEIKKYAQKLLFKLVFMISL